MKKEILSIITIFLTMQLFPQDTKEHTTIIIEDDFYAKMVKTDDELYIYNDNDKYLMNDSPLSFFEGFKKIYQNHKFLEYRVLTTDVFGTTGFDDKIFQCIWFIKNKQLYLANILFNDSEIDDVEKGRKDQYLIMEQLTGEKFNTHYKYISLGGRKIHGLMPATWFTDTLFVKKAFNPKRGLDYESYEKNFENWMESAYLQMVFEKGKLVDMKGIANKTKRTNFVRPKKRNRKTP
ncbi:MULTISPECIES: hypothetical protein [Proteiniphilum]|uniref:hypothetical protein n=1 Tax=Proteiniphilum TaxID=294702 RepID=UPI0003A2926F|nr:MULTISPECIES: hypothetical protein [Proteiniphilum]